MRESGAAAGGVEGAVFFVTDVGGGHGEQSMVWFLKAFRVYELEYWGVRCEIE